MRRTSPPTRRSRSSPRGEGVSTRSSPKRSSPWTRSSPDPPDYHIRRKRTGRSVKKNHQTSRSPSLQKPPLKQSDEQDSKEMDEAKPSTVPSPGESSSSRTNKRKPESPTRSDVHRPKEPPPSPKPSSKRKRSVDEMDGEEASEEKHSDDNTVMAKHSVVESVAKGSIVDRIRRALLRKGGVDGERGTFNGGSDSEDSVPMLSPFTATATSSSPMKLPTGLGDSTDGSGETPKLSNTGKSLRMPQLQSDISSDDSKTKDEAAIKSVLDPTIGNIGETATNIDPKTTSAEIALEHDYCLPSHYAKSQKRRPTKSCAYNILPPIMMEEDREEENKTDTLANTQQEELQQIEGEKPAAGTVPETSQNLPAFMRHLDPDSKVCVLSRRFGKLSSLHARDLPSILQKYASVEPFIPPPPSTNVGQIATSAPVEKPPITVRMARSAPATIISETVRKQVRVEPPLSPGAEVLVTKGPMKGMYGTLVRHLSDGNSTISPTSYSNEKSPSVFVPSRWLQSVSLDDETLKATNELVGSSGGHTRHKPATGTASLSSLFAQSVAEHFEGPTAPNNNRGRPSKRRRKTRSAKTLALMYVEEAFGPSST